jgi:diacylglycerol kinase
VSRRATGVAEAFRYAAAGMAEAFRGQRNVRIHVVAGTLAMELGVLYGLDPDAWMALVTVATVVLALELVNTALEAAVDLAHPDWHPLAKAAKDVVAGAVLVAALGALAVGCIIFGPRLSRLPTLLVTTAARQPAKFALLLAGLAIVSAAATLGGRREPPDAG